MSRSRPGWPVSRRPAATRADHERFCIREGWVTVRDARGRAATHHVTYELALDDGRILRTRISRPVNRDAYGPSMWSHILRDQLDVSADEFWACVRDGIVPVRSRPEEPTGGLPLALVAQLVKGLRLSEEEVRGMTKEQALERLAELWATPE